MNTEMRRTPRDEVGPVRFPPPLIYIAALLASGGLEILVPTPNLPRVLAVASGVAAVAAAILLDGRSMAMFRRKRTAVVPWRPATALVTDGPYRLSRNPMYLGMTLAYLGLSLSLGTLWALAFLPVVIVIVDLAVIRREESYLEEKYGEEYNAYRRSVRRWI